MLGAPKSDPTGMAGRLGLKGRNGSMNGSFYRMSGTRLAVRPFDRQPPSRGPRRGSPAGGSGAAARGYRHRAPPPPPPPSIAALPVPCEKDSFSVFRTEIQEQTLGIH
ncbi:hypothetical protein GCM10012280_04860 [Wenjunlia tyrosinilytica]|uniref:Uncharacterized protein n=1 Tax=Wenjunlia tyrosinilytica TaxID=1544741 RepID=A0A918DTB6_9ACTN|nr:hypothetical protein GCM10012280_04860 [Wenjunlia tyrosinilytica]